MRPGSGAAEAGVDIVCILSGKLKLNTLDRTTGPKRSYCFAGPVLGRDLNVLPSLWSYRRIRSSILSELWTATAGGGASGGRNAETIWENRSEPDTMDQRGMGPGQSGSGKLCSYHT